MSRRHARRYKDALYKFTAILLTVLMALPQNGMTAMANTASSATTGSEAAIQVLDKSASDSKTADATSTSEESATDSATSDSMAAPSATVENDTVSVALQLDHASITYGDQSASAPATQISLPTTSDFSFKAVADDGYSLKDVKTVVGTTEATLTADEDGTYKIAAADLQTGLQVVVEGQEIAQETE
jgi:hypothetical protein